MIRWLVAFLLLVAVLAVAPQLIDEKGYILISFNNWTIEGTIVSFTILLLGTLFIGALLYKLLRYFWNAYLKMRFGILTRSAQRKQTTISDALWAELNGDLELVKRTLEKSDVSEEWKALRLALLAKAALAEKDRHRALDLLSELAEGDKAKVPALWLALDAADEVADSIRKRAGGKKATLLDMRLYTQLLLRTKDTAALAKHFGRIKGSQVLTPEQWHDALELYFSECDGDEAKSRFNQLPRSLKEHAQTYYYSALVRNGLMPEIAAKLIKIVKQGDYTQLLTILSAAQYTLAPEVRSAIQDSLKRQPDEPELLLCLAYLAQLDNEHPLAAKIFDKVLALDHRLPHPQRAIRSYSETAQHDKALLVSQFVA